MTSNVMPLNSPVPLAAPTADLNAVIASQQALLTAQAKVVRDLETLLSLTPGGPAPSPPVAGSNLQNIIDIQTAAIRTQAAYQNHLEDLETALGL